MNKLNLDFNIYILQFMYSNYYNLNKLLLYSTVCPNNFIMVCRSINWFIDWGSYKINLWTDSKFPAIPGKIPAISGCVAISSD